MNDCLVIDESNTEIWVETKTADGKSYYYNAKSRDTTWTKPEGENIKIILQEQVCIFVFCFCCFFWIQIFRSTERGTSRSLHY